VVKGPLVHERLSQRGSPHGPQLLRVLGRQDKALLGLEFGASSGGALRLSREPIEIDFG
jgi:hypothetical protein